MVAQVRLQDPVLLAQGRDDPVLLAVAPADERRDEQLQRKNASSLRQVSVEYSDSTANCRLGDVRRSMEPPFPHTFRLTVPMAH